MIFFLENEEGRKRMNRKGQEGAGGVGILIGIAITLIIGAVLLVPTAQYVGTATTTGTSTNKSFTMPANGSTSDLTPCGQLNTSAVVIYNYTMSAASNDTTGNYSITQATSPTTGYLATRITCNGVTANYFCGYMANVTCTFQPEGYITDAGGRTIAGLIVIFFALGIGVIALIPTLKNKVLELVGR